MKKLQFYLILGAALSLFAGCDKLKEITLDTTILVTFDVAIEDSPASTDIDLTKIVDALGYNSELEKLKEGIKSYTVKSVRYKIWEFYNDPATNLNGHMGAGNTLATEPGMQIPITDISLQSSMDDPEYRYMELSQQDKDKMQQYLLDTNGLKLFLDASVTHQPATFKLTLQIDISTLTEEEK